MSQRYDIPGKIACLFDDRCSVLAVIDPHEILHVTLNSCHSFAFLILSVCHCLQMLKFLDLPWGLLYLDNLLLVVAQGLNEEGPLGSLNFNSLGLQVHALALLLFLLRFLCLCLFARQH